MEYVSCDFCNNDNTEVLFSKRDKFAVSGDDFKVVRCKHCGLIYINPRPDKEEAVKFYPDFYSWKETLTATPFFAKFINNLEKIYRNHLLNYEVNKVLRITKLKGGKVLDVGCGTGDRLVLLRRVGFDISGVEVSSSAQYAKQRHNLDVFEGELFQANLPDNSFDIITLYNVLEHIHNPGQIIKEIRRILKVSGFLIIQVPNTSSWQFRLFKERWAAVDVPRDLYYFNARLLKQVLERERFQPIRIDHFSNWWHPPTFTLSLFPDLDPQFFWQKPDSTWEATCSRIAWALVTVTIAPVFTFLERLLKRSAIVTVYARKR